MDYKKYLDSFEKQIVIVGVERKLFGKEGMAPLKECKLSSTQFGRFVGSRINCPIPMAIDYYGMIKKSSGLIDVVNNYHGLEIKSILVKVAYFASIKNEHINELAPELLENYPLFKKFMIELRGFKISQN